MLKKTLAASALLTSVTFLGSGASYAAPTPQPLQEAPATATTTTPLPPLVLHPELKLLNAKAPTTTTSTTTIYTNYTVKRGDTLYAIAKRYNTTVAKIATASHVADVNRIRVGQVLSLPQTVTTSTPSSTLAAWQCKVFSGDPQLKPWVGRVRSRIGLQFGVKTIYGYRPGDPQDHGSGLALDVMVPQSGVLGDTVATWAKNNSKALNVKYVIWRQHIWAPYRDSEGWRAMADRGSITQNHYDHVHISFYDGYGTCPV